MNDPAQQNAAALIDPVDIAPSPHDTPAQTLEKARAYVRLVSQLFRRLTRLTAPLFEQHHITSTQYLVLLWVRNHAGITQAGLVDLLDLDANTISDVARRMQRKGLLVRKRHPHDGRAFTLHVTPAGGRLVTKIRGQIDKLSLQCFALLPSGHEIPIAEWLAATAQITMESPQ